MKFNENKMKVPIYVKEDPDIPTRERTGARGRNVVFAEQCNQRESIPWRGVQGGMNGERFREGSISLP